MTTLMVISGLIGYSRSGTGHVGSRFVPDVTTQRADASWEHGDDMTGGIIVFDLRAREPRSILRASFTTDIYGDDIE